jgi:2',3'-cyclic-nucleotide 2'-phosphodiesterase (5'-nucleotidase family)
MGFQETTSPTEARQPASTGDYVMAEAAENLRKSSTGERAPEQSWSKMGAEIGGTFAAGIAGTAFWALAGRAGLGVPGKIIGTALLSGGARTGVQTGIEHAFVDDKDRSTTKDMFLWGMVDGFAGVAGAAAEARMASWYTKKLGMSYLGSGVSQDLAFNAGRKAVENSLAAKLKLNAARGVTGGAVGGFVWGVPHELHENKDQLHTAQGWGEVGKGLVLDTTLGGVSGGIFSSAFTAAANYRDVAGYVGAALRGDRGQTKVRLLHFNDMHSSLLGDESTLSQLAHRAKELRTDASKNGRSSLLFDAGDNFSGTPEAGLSDVGYLETKAIQKMGADGFVPGNHVADAGNAEVDIHGWYRAITRIRSELNRDIPGVAANIEVPAYPGFAGPNGQIYKPYRVVEIAGANGQTERVGVVGLVTKELIDGAKTGDIKYLDPEQEAKRWISHLNKPASEGGEGINKVIVLSHLGRNEDVQLAKNVQGISYIVSAHSHDAEPVILWGRNAATGWDVPILQAGSQAKWLAQTDLSFKPNGAADKYRTFGRLHRIDSSVPHDPEIRDFLHQHLRPMLDLENQKLNATVAGAFHMDGVRGSFGRQTELGYLIARGIREEVNNRLPQLNATRMEQGLEPIKPLHIMLKHTGEIREELPAGQPSIRTVARMFLNTGSVERETRELAAAQLTGDELLRVLNFGVQDFPTPVHLQNNGDRGWPKISRMIREVFGAAADDPHHDYPGNFLQTDGLKYDIDLGMPPGQRVKSIEVLNPTTGEYMPIVPDQKYHVLTYNHPIEKWNKNGVFGPELQAGGEQAIRNHVNAQSIPLSQVDLMKDFLERQQMINPIQFWSENIRNYTPPRWRPFVRPTFGTMSGVAANEEAASGKKQTN